MIVASKPKIKRRCWIYLKSVEYRWQQFIRIQFHRFPQNHFANAHNVRIKRKIGNDLISRNRTLYRKIGHCQWFCWIWGTELLVFVPSPIWTFFNHISWIHLTRKKKQLRSMYAHIDCTILSMINFEHDTPHGQILSRIRAY